MGSLCTCSSEEDANQVDRSTQEPKLIVWGDLVNSETRIVMTLLSMARVRYEMQQVTTPDIDYGSGMQTDSQPDKEHFLEMPLENL